MEELDQHHKAVREIRVYGIPLEIMTLAALIEQRLDGVWFRSHENEKGFRQRTDKVHYIFTLAHTESHQGIALDFLATEYGLTLFKLMPELTPLSIDESNAISMDFFLRFVDEAVLDLELLSEISPAEICEKHGRKHEARIIIAEF